MEIAGGGVGDYHLDGKSILPIINGESGFERDAIYLHSPLYIPHYDKTPSSLIRTDDYKLIYFHGDSVHESDFNKIIPGERYELYRISDDISEQQDLSKEMPEKTAELKSKLHAWLKETGAKMPTRNPDFDPENWLYHPYARVDYNGEIIYNK